MRGVFVTGTGTEVGKTAVAAAVARTAAGSGQRVAVFKPAVSGLDEGGEADHELLRRAAGSGQSDDEIAPYRFGPAVSPHLAAELAGTPIEPRVVLEAARAAAENADLLVCEGVGGFLVPLTPGWLVRDLARELDLPWPTEPSGLERSNRETIASIGDVEVMILSSLDLAAPERWPRLEPLS